MVSSELLRFKLYLEDSDGHRNAFHPAVSLNYQDKLDSMFEKRCITSVSMGFLITAEFSPSYGTRPESNTRKAMACRFCATGEESGNGRNSVLFG